MKGGANYMSLYTIAPDRVACSRVTAFGLGSELHGSVLCVTKLQVPRDVLYYRTVPGILENCLLT